MVCVGNCAGKEHACERAAVCHTAALFPIAVCHVRRFDIDDPLQKVPPPGFCVRTDKICTHCFAKCR